MAVEEVRETEATEAIEAAEGTVETGTTAEIAAEIVEASAEASAQAAAAVAAQTLYSIAPGYTLNVRSGPGTQYRLIRTLAPGSKVPIFCQRPGETISGPYGTTKIWDNIEVGEYVSDAYVRTGSDGYVASRCA
ncbi:SH3 domain-containing protein [Streptomyces sp. LRE541]|uniref:SH3 domain-containing protein n=1 Tax=Streptomyces sp. LRE541 TaxID=2931983 RepID=UPI00200E2169|nr:SH3 domain-containing protein [Streptomyces sp. LRE541]UPZ30562.1 SH3 domain-containing protein [Streptomyces sp. LRE541]